MKYYYLKPKIVSNLEIPYRFGYDGYSTDGTIHCKDNDSGWSFSVHSRDRKGTLNVKSLREIWNNRVAEGYIRCSENDCHDYMKLI